MRLFALSLLLFFGLPRVQSQTSDESGTLVMAARVNDAVIISVDSKISGNGSGKGFLAAPTPGIDSTRKLIAVGRTSACAISGYLGTIGTGLNVTPALRDWVTAHPTIEAMEALPELLAVVIEVWERHSYSTGELPRGRGAGDNITSLVCGGISEGEPRLVWGRVVVGEGRRAVLGTLSEDLHDFLYVGGIIQTAAEFSHLAVDPNYQPFDDSLNRIATDLRLVLRKNKINANSYNVWNRAKDTSESSTGRVASNSIPMGWDLANAKLLFTLVFASVEKNAEAEVAPPNNAYIIRPCGRLLITVEQEPWPECTEAGLSTPPH